MKEEGTNHISQVITEERRSDRILAGDNKTQYRHHDESHEPDADHHGHGHHDHPQVRPASIVVSAILLLAGIFLEPKLHGTPYVFMEYVIFITAYLLVGGKVLREAVTNLLHGKIFDEFFLMSVATLGALAIHQLPEAVSVMLFFAVGEYLQDLALDKSRKAIASLIEIRPDTANLKVRNDDGRNDIQVVHPDSVDIGDIIIVKPGERIPLDGKVIEGTSFLDTSALTGESVPRRISPGCTALALIVKGAFIIAGILGAATMWEAVFADVGVALLAILNSTRVLRKRHDIVQEQFHDTGGGLGTPVAL